MKSLKDAQALAEEMVSIGKLAGKDMTAVISDMDQPLGYAVGNALEVKEAILTLQGKGPKDLEELVLVLGAYMTVKAGKADTPEEAAGMLKDSLESGKAFQTFLEFIRAQGGDPEEAVHPERLPQAAFQEPLLSAREGYICDILTEEVGKVCLLLGGGRETKDSSVDLSVGLVLCRKKGDYVKKGEPLAVIHANDRHRLEEAGKKLAACFEFSDTEPAGEPLIKAIIN